MSLLNDLRAGQTPSFLEEVARREKVSLEHIRSGLLQGTLIVPRNPAHKRLEPIAIGKGVSTKINANIGNSLLSSGLDEELEKISAELEAHDEQVKIAELLNELSDEELDKLAEELGIEDDEEKVASDDEELMKQAEDAYNAGRIMAHGFMDELNTEEE